MVSWQSYHKYTEQLFSARQSFAQVNSAVDIRHDPKYVSTLNIQVGLFWNLQICRMEIGSLNVNKKSQRQLCWIVLWQLHELYLGVHKAQWFPARWVFL